MRWIILSIAAATLAACAAAPIAPEAFVKPDDCFDLSKHNHPAYIDSCGNER